MIAVSSFHEWLNLARNAGLIIAVFPHSVADDKNGSAPGYRAPAIKFRAVIVKI
jgi:hypothetical protein